MRRNGRPKGWFWRVRFFSSHLRFSGDLRANLNGAEKKTDTPKTPFWTTVSPHDAFSAPFRGNPRVSKISVRNSGAGNGCANFMGAWKKCALSAGKTHVHKIPRFRGGGVFWAFGGGGGGSADLIFMGARIFLILWRALTKLLWTPRLF